VKTVGEKSCTFIAILLITFRQRLIKLVLFKTQSISKFLVFVRDVPIIKMFSPNCLLSMMGWLRQIITSKGLGAEIWVRW